MVLLVLRRRLLLSLLVNVSLLGLMIITLTGTAWNTPALGTGLGRCLQHGRTRTWRAHFTHVGRLLSLHSSAWRRVSSHGHAHGVGHRSTCNWTWRKGHWHRSHGWSASHHLLGSMRLVHLSCSCCRSSHCRQPTGRLDWSPLEPFRTQQRDKLRLTQAEKPREGVGAHGTQNIEAQQSREHSAGLWVGEVHASSEEWGQDRRRICQVERVRSENPRRLGKVRGIDLRQRIAQQAGDGSRTQALKGGCERSIRLPDECCCVLLHRCHFLAA
mmetsp:Transcript_30801/g.81834  ORF Transcript_30801/g.81834 Transcript_30801/m.81834 type:complete len:271 (-) Transcript_30801:87-899(-)